MGDFHLLSLLMLSSAFILLCFCMRLFYTIWWKPMKLQTQLRQQGIQGHPYKLLYGNIKDNMRSLRQSQSKPINLTHQIAPRAVPFFHQTAKDYGKISLTWFGTIPRVSIMDPELIREVLSNKFGHFEKVKSNPLTRLLATGLASYGGEKWAQHRRILNPAFHQEKLKCMLPAMFTSCSQMISQWEQSVGSDGYCETNVWPEFQNLTGDVISRTAFGSSYKDGIRIFQLQNEQAILVIKAARTIYIPGFRFLPTKENIRRKEIDREMRALLHEFKAHFHFPTSLACLHRYSSTAMALRFHVFFFIFIASILLLSHTAKAGAAEDKLLDGINKYRASSNLPPLTQNKNAECLADQIAEQFEKQDCSNTTGADTVPGTENQFPNYPKLLDHCSLNITTTKDGVIMPACVPNLESNLVLSNFTKSQYSVNLNDSQYTGVGLASEDNWIVVVLTTSSPTGNFAPASNVAGLVLKVGSHCYFLSFLLGLLMVLMS